MTKRILSVNEYWNMSYIKRVTSKIRSACGPLIMGLQELRELMAFGWGWSGIFGRIFQGRFREGVLT
jgi:hypothetical protein